jgi:hypothetical protein
MVLVTKLKAASASAVALAGLALGVGLAVVPTAAGQSTPAESTTKQPLATAARPLDDVAFLRRACVDLRGTPPTDLEQGLFHLDPDPKKRTKVVEWLLSEEPAKAVTNLNVSNPILTGTLNTNGLTTFSNLAGTSLNTGSLTLTGTSSLAPLTFGTLSQPTVSSTLTTGLLTQVPYTTALGQATLVGQKTPATTTKPADPPEDPERVKLKQEIAGMKAKIEALERLREKQAAAEKQKAATAAVAQEKAELEALATKLKALEEEKAKQEKKPLGDSTQTRETAAAALLKLATLQEQANKAQTEKLVKDKLAKLRDEKLAQEKQANEYRKVVGEYYAVKADTDASFLQRVVKQAYGVPATALELKYFAEDKDPKKREKLVDLVLADPAVAKKLGPDAKTKLLADPAKPKTVVEHALTTRTVPYTTADGPKTRLETYYTTKARVADPFAKLLDQVLDGKRTDEQIADAISLATVGRYPTEAEQKIMLASVAGAKEQKAAWKKVLDTLATTTEAQAHAEALKKK